MAARIYITGATGRLGQVVLDKTGAIPLVRKKSGLNNEIVTDFSSDNLKEILKNADVILHIAGSVDSADKKKLWEANVGLTKKIVEAVPKKCKIVFAGSISIYGKKLDHIPVKETDPANPDSDYAKTKYEAERIVANHPEHVILRIGPVYGPQFDDYFNVLRMIEKEKMKIIGDGENRIPFVHVDDVAEIFAKAVKKGSGIYNITGWPLKQREIYEIAAKELGVETPTKTLEMRSAMLLAAFLEVWCRITKTKPKMTRGHIAILGHDRVFDCSKARREFGFSPKPLEDGIKEIVDVYKKRKPYKT